jgi:hypothetical protein
VVAIQVAKYSVKFSKGNFAANLRDEGFINANVDGSSRTVRVTVLFAQKVFQADQALIYSAKAGKSGKTNLP